MFNTVLGDELDDSQDRESTSRDLNKYNKSKETKLIHSTMSLLEHLLKRKLRVRMMPRKKTISENVEKRSPACLLWCLRKRVLHPAQCHSYC